MQYYHTIFELNFDFDRRFCDYHQVSDSIDDFIMICSDCVITGEVKVVVGAVIHPKVTITADEGKASSIGANTIIEETSRIHNSSIGDNSLLEVGVVLSSVSFSCAVVNCFQITEQKHLQPNLAVISRELDLYWPKSHHHQLHDWQ